MRLFTAIDLSEDVLNRIDSLTGKLRPLARIAWSPSANLHITTKFIGQWPEDRLSQLERTLGRLDWRGPIRIRVNGLGFFPSAKEPRVFFAGVEASSDLAVLVRDTNEALSIIQIEPQTRAYRPHLTLARIRKPTKLSTFRKEVELLGQPEFGEFIADRFFLYLSKPGPAGSVYTKLSEFPFSR